MDNIGLMERFADPELFTGLDFGEKMAGAGITTLMGMGVTFIVLILLSAIIIYMEKFFMRVENKGKDKLVKSGEIVPAETKASSPGPAVTVGDQSELIAVISAAIAACEGNGMSSNLVVRKINRVAGPTIAWSSQGQLDAIASRKF